MEAAAANQHVAELIYLGKARCCRCRARHLLLILSFVFCLTDSASSECKPIDTNRFSVSSPICPMIMGGKVHPVLSRNHQGLDVGRDTLSAKTASSKAASVCPLTSAGQRSRSCSQLAPRRASGQPAQVSAQLPRLVAALTVRELPAEPAQFRHS